MGQINLPVLNRVGYKTYWDYSNENLISFVKCICENFFTKGVAFSLFNRYTRRSFFFLKRKKLCILKNFSNLSHTSVPYEDYFSIRENILNFNKFIFNYEAVNYKLFFTKFFFFKFQQWIFITVKFFLTGVSEIKQNFKNKQDENIFFLKELFFFIHILKKKDFSNGKKRKIFF